MKTSPEKLVKLCVALLILVLGQIFLSPQINAQTDSEKETEQLIQQLQKKGILKRTTPSVNTQEILYVSIFMSGSIESIQMNDSQGKTFEPFFLFNPKNQKKIEWLQKTPANEAEKAQKKSFVENILKPLPNTKFNANASQAWFCTDATGDYEILFSLDGIAEIEVLRGIGEVDTDSRPTDLTFVARYLDVSDMPKGTMLKLKTNLSGIAELTFDADNDGVFEGFVKPTAILYGEKAGDTQAPNAEISVKYFEKSAVVTVSAIDDLTGVRAIFYSIDEKADDGSKFFQKYEKPFIVQFSEKPISVEVFTEDNAGNRQSFTKTINFKP